MATTLNPLLIPGSVVQVVSALYTSAATTSNAFPIGTAAYTNTQGAEFMSLSITPKSATNILIVSVYAVMFVDSSNATTGYGLWRDAGVNPVAASGDYPVSAAGGRMANGSLLYTVVAGSTAATTFKFRAGQSGGTMSFNCIGTGTALSAGSVKSSMTITEISA